jgi:hypothetical protein
MTETKPAAKESSPDSMVDIVDYVIHQYGLTREEAREVVRLSAGDRALIDAEAGRLKAQKRP